MQKIPRLDSEFLTEIIENLPMAILVTDGNGKILLQNLATKRLHNLKHDIVGYNVAELIKQGYWENSAVLEAIRTKKTSVKLIKYYNDNTSVSISIPIMDENDNIKFIITNSSDEEIIKLLTLVLDQEQQTSNRYRRELEYLRSYKDENIISKSSAMNNVLKQALAVSGTDSTVILYGETGVGKDVVANFIHNNSLRSDKSFVAINCAAIPDNLLESELFGYEKGSFTGANTKGKSGLLEIAHEGTLFLDEIGEMPVTFQAKLLRVLEDGSFRRIGGNTIIQTNARIICATNRNLKKMVEEKKFREDLYYRLNMFSIEIPPLRERTDDILPLAYKFLHRLNKKYGTNKYLSANAEEAMLSYKWPGNARELRNVISRSYILAEGDVVDWFFSSQLEFKKPENSNELYHDMNEGLTLREYREKSEELYVRYILSQCNGNVEAAANRLGIHRSQVYRKLKTWEHEKDNMKMPHKYGNA